MEVSEYEELRGALREGLERKNQLAKLRALIRANIFAVLEENSGVEDGPSGPPLAAISDENVLINELIFDYLSFNGYKNTLSVFRAETGTNGGLKQTKALFQEDSRYPSNFPHIYGIVAGSISGKDKIASEKR